MPLLAERGIDINGQVAERSQDVWLMAYRNSRALTAFNTLSISSKTVRRPSNIRAELFHSVRMATMATYRVPKVENENNVGGNH